MITAEKSRTLTWETADSTGTMEVLEIVSREAGDSCSEDQKDHESRGSDGEILICAYVGGEWKWVRSGRG